MPLDPRLFNTNSAALSELKWAYKNKTLSIIVGAGSSVQAGLPTWYQVLDELLLHYIELKYSGKPYNFFSNDIRDYMLGMLREQSNTIFAQVIKARLSHDEYLELVHKALYGRLSAAPRPGPIAEAVSRLHDGLHAVVALNFDDLIESAFIQNGLACSSIWSPSHLPSATGVPIYHPHGFLPYIRQSSAHYWIVFSEDEYHSQYYSSLGWSNVTLMHALFESTCLFVSTSITDPNLRRLLDYAHRELPDKHNFFAWSTPEPGSLSGLKAMLSDTYGEMFAEAFAKLGLFPLWFFNTDGRPRWDDIPDLLDEIAAP